ncbi:MAG TPA: hypothetical protein VM778_13895 [Gemmatimonadota bacterium]|nr:hypothetical protein [Gemmatimonadota bacterium]
MSTGVKVAIGCGIALVVVLIVMVVVAIAGGMLLKNKAGDLTGGLEAQAEATRTVRRLESENPFTAPPDGVVGEERAERFLAVTDDAWDQVGDRVEEMAERGRQMEEGDRAGVGDVALGMRSLGGARVALAEALEERDSSVSEYLWTGITLQRAYESLDLPGASGVPAENLALAGAHRGELAEIFEGDDTDKGFILGMAWTMGAGEGAVRGALGMDTLRPPPGQP